MNQAAHQLDLMLWLCGEMPQRVHGFCYTGMERAIEVENDALVHMVFPDGATGQFTASSREFPGTNRLELIGDSGQIVVENDCRVVYTKLLVSEREYAKSADCFFGPVPHEVSEQIFPPADNFVQQSAIINDFLAAAQTGGAPICTPEQAQRSLTVINAAYLSAWEERDIVLPLDTDLFATQLQKRFI